MKDRLILCKWSNTNGICGFVIEKKRIPVLTENFYGGDAVRVTKSKLFESKIYYECLPMIFAKDLFQAGSIQECMCADFSKD